MKRVFFAILMSLLMSCKQNTENIDYGGTLESIKTEQVQTCTMVETTTSFSSTEFSNYCYVKKLPRNINKWDVSQMRDYESGMLIKKYLYMPSYNDIYTLKLTVNQNDTTFIVTNRVQH